MVIIVEGKDDKNFLISLFNDLKLNKQISVKDNINFDDYIEVMGGKRKLLDKGNPKYQKLSMKIDHNDIEKVLFLFDCDFEQDDKDCNGMDKSLQCFNSLKKELKWTIPIDVYIFNRNLDYFLIETIKNKDCYDDFKSLIDCLNIENLKPNRKPIANLYRDLYPYPQFDFKDNRFDELKQKLQNLFKEQK